MSNLDFPLWIRFS